MTLRSLTIYHHGQIWLNLGKINLLPVKNRVRWWKTITKPKTASLPISFSLDSTSPLIPNSCTSFSSSWKVQGVWRMQSCLPSHTFFLLQHGSSPLAKDWLQCELSIGCSFFQNLLPVLVWGPVWTALWISAPVTSSWSSGKLLILTSSSPWAAGESLTTSAALFLSHSSHFFLSQLLHNTFNSLLNILS